MKNQLPYIFALNNRGISSMSHENKIPEIAVLYFLLNIKLLPMKKLATLHLYIV